MHNYILLPLEFTVIDLKVNNPENKHRLTEHVEAYTSKYKINQQFRNCLNKSHPNRQKFITQNDTSRQGTDTEEKTIPAQTLTGQGKTKTNKTEKKTTPDTLGERENNKAALTTKTTTNIKATEITELC